MRFPFLYVQYSTSGSKTQEDKAVLFMDVSLSSIICIAFSHHSFSQTHPHHISPIQTCLFNIIRDTFKLEVVNFTSTPYHKNNGTVYDIHTQHRYHLVLLNKDCISSPTCSVLVDLAGIEPASESPSIPASPITVIILTFPPSPA